MLTTAWTAILGGITVMCLAGFALGCRRLARLRQQGDEDWGKQPNAKRVASLTMWPMIGLFLLAPVWYLVSLPPEVGLGESSQTPPSTTITMMLGLFLVEGSWFWFLFRIYQRFAREVELEGEGAGE